MKIFSTIWSTLCCTASTPKGLILLKCLLWIAFIAVVSISTGLKIVFSINVKGHISLSGIFIAYQGCDEEVVTSVPPTAVPPGPYSSGGSFVIQYL